MQSIKSDKKLNNKLNLFAVDPAVLFKKQYDNKFQMILQYWMIGIASTEHALKTSAVHNFIHDDNSKFDLIIAEQFFQESLLLFSHKYQAPIITISEHSYYKVIN